MGGDCSDGVLEVLADIVETIRFCSIDGGTDRRDQAAVGCQQGADETKPFREAVPLVWYATGEWIDGQLKPDATSLLDCGDRLYAPRSHWADGRRIQFGWIRTDLDPAPVGASLGVMSAPRDLVLGDDGRLRVTPARELHRLRDIAVVGRMSPGATRTVIELGEPSSAIEASLDESDAGVMAVRRSTTDRAPRSSRT